MFDLLPCVLLCLASSWVLLYDSWTGADRCATDSLVQQRLGLTVLDDRGAKMQAFLSLKTMHKQLNFQPVVHVA